MDSKSMEGTLFILKEQENQSKKENSIPKNNKGTVFSYFVLFVLIFASVAKLAMNFTNMKPDVENSLENIHQKRVLLSLKRHEEEEKNKGVEGKEKKIEAKEKKTQTEEKKEKGSETSANKQKGKSKEEQEEQEAEKEKEIEKEIEEKIEEEEKRAVQQGQGNPYDIGNEQMAALLNYIYGMPWNIGQDE